MSFLERLREIHETEWKPVSPMALAAGSVVVLIIVLIIYFIRRA
jgi:hypothetical protein